MNLEKYSQCITVLSAHFHLEKVIDQSATTVFVPYHERSDIKLVIGFHVGKDCNAMKKLAKKIAWE